MTTTKERLQRQADREIEHAEAYHRAKEADWTGQHSYRAIRALEERTGYEKLNVLTVRCKAKMPATVWREIAVTERPTDGFHSGVVFVEDGRETVAVLSSRHYTAIMDRIGELERWVAELITEEAAS